MPGTCLGPDGGNIDKSLVTSHLTYKEQSWPSTRMYSETICGIPTHFCKSPSQIGTHSSAHQWQFGVSRLAGCHGAWYSRAYQGVSPIAYLSPFLSLSLSLLQHHLRTSQSGNQIIPWTCHAESMVTPLTGSWCSLCLFIYRIAFKLTHERPKSQILNRNKCFIFLEIKYGMKLLEALLKQSMREQQLIYF